MKEIVVISGKGGTGKTFFTGCLAIYLKNKVIVDCDVDAANLHLILKPKVKEEYEFWSGKIASIDEEKCTSCGSCKEVCKFSAIEEREGGFYIDHLSCEGCTICSYVCPSEAIILKDRLCGHYYISETEEGPFVHARLGIAQENSGKLVTKLREIAKNIAKKEEKEYIVIDGPPGVGCPVMASITGVNLAVVVTEPTLSGLHDLERVLKICQHFKVPAKVIINKFDLNEKLASEIESKIPDLGGEFLGKIPFSQDIAESIRQGVPFLKFSKNSISQTILSICEKVRKYLE